MNDNSIKIYNIPTGIPFADCLAKGILDYFGDHFCDNPEIIAKTTIFLPSKQIITRLRDAFFRINKGKILLLPKMRIIGELDDAEKIALATHKNPLFSALQSTKPMPNSIRIPVLARFILNHHNLLPHINDYQSALSMAGNIVDLLDLLYNHSQAPDILHQLNPQEFTQQWHNTLDIILPFYPLWQDYLSTQGYCEPLQYQSLRYAFLADYWTHTSTHNPIIIAGISPDNRLALPFLQAIHNLPNGHIILSGLDTHLIADDATHLSPQHPQYALYQLLSCLNADITALKFWHSSTDFLTQSIDLRTKLCTEIMRSPNTTEAWHTIAHRLSEEDIISATESFKIIQTPNDRTEATVIALIIREALENPHKKIAFFTPQTELIARVSSVLNRWQIKPTNHAGICLADTPQGLYIRLLCDVLVTNFAPIALLSLLKHPLTYAGLPHGEFKQQVYLFEKYILRGNVIKNGFHGYQKCLDDYYDALDKDSQAYPQRLETYHRLDDFLAFLQNRFLDIVSLSDSVKIKDFIEIFKTIISELTCADTQSTHEMFWHDEAGQKCLDVCDLLQTNSDFIGIIPQKEIYTLILKSLSQHSVRLNIHGMHPQIHIWQIDDLCFNDADIIIIGGLTEGTFPQSPKTGIWLSRPMREQLGLSLPEAQIGTQAFYFAQALGNKTVFLTHSLQSNGSPTMPSRWLIRFENVLKGALKNPHTLKQIYDTPYGDWADMLDNPQTKPMPAGRPEPKPPIHVRPTAISVTDAEKWIRDPYFIYCKHILKLQKLYDINQDLQAAYKGDIIHKILYEFTLATTDGFGGNPHNTMMNIVHKFLDKLRNNPSLYVFWKEKLVSDMMQFVDFEINRRKNLMPIMYEQTGKFTFATSNGEFTLKARCDRIDKDNIGNAIVLDYKTSSGAAASYTQVKSGFAPQLPLQAMMLKQGGFGKAYPIAGAEYIIINHGIEIKPMTSKKEIDNELLFTDLVDDIFEQFKNWVELFNDENTGYISRRLPEFLKFTGDYDLLARVPEWSLTDDTDEEEGE